MTAYRFWKNFSACCQRAGEHSVYRPLKLRAAASTSTYGMAYTA